MYKRSIFFYLITISFSIYALFALLNSHYMYKNKTSSNILAIIASNSIKDECLSSSSSGKYDYAKKYAQYLDKCHTKRSNETDEIVRAVLFYFPLENADTFAPELKWMYQSWLEMLRHQAAKWRTDLVLFVKKFNQTHEFDFFSKLNCSFLNVRTSNQDTSMCTLIEYEPVDSRKVVLSNTDDISFDYLYGSFDIFEPSRFDLANFNAKIKSDLSHYSYTDSIMIAFDGYEYLKSKYDYVIRSDLDVFLTPGFAKWTPQACGEFNVGRGGYSTRFNMKRLNRIANFIGLRYNFTANLGSTWYSTPENFRLVSYLTLVSMAYLSNEEFSKTEREGKLAARLWPDWHYGVIFFNLKPHFSFI